MKVVTWYSSMCSLTSKTLSFFRWYSRSTITADSPISRATEAVMYA